MESKTGHRSNSSTRLKSTFVSLRKGDGRVWTVVSLTAIVLLAVIGALVWPGPAPAQPSAVSESPAAPVSVAQAPAQVAAVDPSQAPAPGMDPQFAPPDGPGPDSPPFGVDALSMRDELRTHGVDLPDDKLHMLVDTADKYIAQGDPDLDAWDPRIMADVKALWPDLDQGHVIDVTRCTAEYIERVIARNNGWAHPPDEDDHNDVVDGRGPQPRVTPVVNK